MNIYKLSPSALNLMLDCPRCFWLTHHKVWERPSNGFPSLPNGMDRVLKAHFDKFMEKGELPPEIKEHEHCKGLKLFDDKELLNEWRNARKGLWFEDEMGNVLHGAVDNVMIKEEILIVLDYKTKGFGVKDDDHKKYQLQMDSYNFLLRKMGRKTTDYAFLLFYYPNKVLETGEVIFDTRFLKVKTNPRDAEKVWKDAIELLNDDCPEKGCKWCELIK